MTNVEKAKELGILEDLLENNTEEEINAMTGKQILNEWLTWEGIIGYHRSIFKIIEAFYELKNKE